MNLLSFIQYLYIFRLQAKNYQCWMFLLEFSYWQDAKGSKTGFRPVRNREGENLGRIRPLNESLLFQKILFKLSTFKIIFTWFDTFQSSFDCCYIFMTSLYFTLFLACWKSVPLSAYLLHFTIGSMLNGQFTDFKHVDHFTDWGVILRL